MGTRKGGVRLAKSIDEVSAHATAMLGRTLVTKQTGEAGKEVKRVYIEDGCDIAREIYLSILMDRATSELRSWPPRKAAWISRKSPRNPGENH